MDDADEEGTADQFRVNRRKKGLVCTLRGFTMNVLCGRLTFEFKNSGPSSMSAKTMSGQFCHVISQFSSDANESLLNVSMHQIFIWTPYY